MKKLTLIIIGIMLLFSARAFAGDPTGGTITTSVRTNTTILVQLTTAPTAIDSVFVCYFEGTSTDTTFAAQADSVTTAKVLSGLKPSTRYIVFLLTRQGAGAKTAISDKDTVTTYGPEIEASPTSGAQKLIEQIIRAVSWRPSTVLTSFTVNGATGADSSGHYYAWKTNNIVVKASQAGDSVKVMCYVHYGYRNMTQTGDIFGFGAAVDSLNINEPGVFRKTLSSNMAGQVMYFRFAGWSGNGKNAAIEVYAIRDRY